MYKRICKICGKEFQVELKRLKTAKYCSMKCYGISKKGKSSWNKGKKLHYTIWNKGKRIKCVCKNCNKVFERPEGYFKFSKGEFCSQKCVWVYHGKRFKYQYRGDGNPVWKGGNSPYYFRIKSIEIYGFNCQNCGTNKRVDTHHLDGNPMNNPSDGSNWARLCNLCHQLLDGRIAKRTKERKTFICEKCHKSFQKKFVYMEKTLNRFCSTRCANSIRERNELGQLTSSPHSS